MTVFQLFRSEIKRMTSGILPRLTILALAMVPILYGAVYLYANWDPYGNLKNLDAALVVEDKGATMADGTTLDAGQNVAKNLQDTNTFNWIPVDSEQAANDGVESGKYSFALIIPEDFSEALASPSDFDSSRQAILQVTTNDANNYLLSSIVDKLTTEVHNSVAKEVGEETANKLLTGFGQIHAQIVKAADGADQLANGTSQARDGANQLRDGIGQLSDGSQRLVDGQAQLVDGANRLRDGTAQLTDGANQLNSGLGELKNKTAALPEQTAKLADGAQQVADGNRQLADKITTAVQDLRATEDSVRKAVEDRTAQLVDAGILTQEQADQILTDLDAAANSSAVKDAQAQVDGAVSQVNRLADGAQQVADGNRQLADNMPALVGGISQASDGAAQLASGAAELSSGAGTLAAGQQSAYDGAVQLRDGLTTARDGSSALADGVGKVDDGAHELASQLRKGAGTVPNPTDAQRQDAARVISDPVKVEDLKQTQANSYGAGLAPFFLALALWIGVFMLIQAMRPITKRALASNARSWKIAVGGWLPFLAIAALQATLLFAVVQFGLGLDTAYPWLTWLLMLLAAMAFTAIIQGVVALLGTVGKFVVLILLVMQLVSAGGTFPWQTIPEPLQIAHQILPLGYVVTGMRQLIYGGELSQVVPVVAALFFYTAIGLLLSTLAARKHKLWTLKTLQPEIAV